jgi:Domain of unknown function (DUF4269)
MGQCTVDFLSVVQELDLLARLSEFNPMLIGTPPLGLAVPGSDIDVACSSDSLDAFVSSVEARFGMEQEFQAGMVRWVAPPAALVTFQRSGWTIELFCQTLPTERQVGVRHFLVEQRLLQMEPSLGQAVRACKRAGHNTEEAFARSLGLSEPDPFKAILDLEGLDDAELRCVLQQGFARPRFQ